MWLTQCNFNLFTTFTISTTYSTSNPFLQCRAYSVPYLFACIGFCAEFFDMQINSFHVCYTLSWCSNLRFCKDLKYFLINQHGQCRVLPVAQLVSHLFILYSVNWSGIVYFRDIKWNHFRSMGALWSMAPRHSPNFFGHIYIHTYIQTFIFTWCTSLHTSSSSITIITSLLTTEWGSPNPPSIVPSHIRLISHMYRISYTLVS